MFCRGLAANGYSVVSAIRDPRPDDILVTWNRYWHYDVEARRFEAAGARVVVAENGYLGRNWRGGDWFALAVGHHAGKGTWHYGGPERWDAWDVELAPWRAGTETLILGQRGIGELGIASPVRWAERTQGTIGGRIRAHPGDRPAVPLEADLAQASAVVTWASAAALKALLVGVPVFYELPGWIGAEACAPLSEFPRAKRDDAARLSMFRRLAHTNWSLAEIGSGEAFRSVLEISAAPNLPQKG